MTDQLLSFDDALAKLLGFVRPLRDTEEVDTMQADGRVLAAAQFSTIDQPPMDNSAMDGYALRMADFGGAGSRFKVSQRIAAGDVGQALAPHTVARIFTGAPLPPGADTVVMQEAVDVDGDEVIIQATPRAGEWVRRRGEDVAAGDELLPAGHRLTPQALALAASTGLARLPVFRRMRVAVFSTGSELVMPGEPLPPGGIYNSNRFVLRALLARLGCEVADFGIIPDRLDATREAFRRAAGANDLILTSGGVSVGEEDHVKPAVEAEGSLDLWKIAMKPGKPLAYGRVGESAFIGLPGNPVSSFVTFLLMVRPFVLATQGAGFAHNAGRLLPAAFDWPKPDRRREFLRARINETGEVELFSRQGSAAIQSTVWANALVDVLPGQTITRGERVRVLPYAELMD